MALVKTENVGNQFAGLGGLPVLRQLGLMIGLAASVAIGVAIVMWSQTPGYRLLYSDLSAADSAQVASSLQQSGLEYKVDEADGSVWVSGASMHEARMLLASQGLPEGGNVGFELMDNTDGFSSSQFVESVRYQRALEGELARTISTIKSVQTARVHLAIPKQSAFVRNRKKPSASVTVGLYAGRTLEAAQVRAIVNLVSSSVPELEAGHVTVVDQAGKMLTDETSGDMVFNTRQLDYKHQIEESYAKRIEGILSPIVGDGRIRAQVNADIDFTITEQTQELFNPDQSAVRSEQTSQETRGGGNGPNGVPGALSNQPPEAGTVEDTNGNGATASAASSVVNNMLSSTRNFELDKTISHTRLATGNIRRLSVAVLVDDKQVAGPEGQLNTTPFNEEEIQRLNQLVKDAVGFNVRRGDSVSVINAAFTPIPVPEPLPEPPIWQQDWVLDIAKQALGGIAVLLLIFGVLRPVMRELAQKGIELKEVQGTAAIEHGDEDAQVTISGAQNAAAQIQQQSHDSNLNTAISMVDQDPRTVANVLKNWVATENG